MSVITNISFDHTQFLGNTLAQIAAEKAGIIKKNTPVVIGETTDETRPVFESKAAAEGAPIFFAEDRPELITTETGPDDTLLYHTASYGTLTGELSGCYQTKNTNTVLCAVKQLEKIGLLVACSQEKNIDLCHAELQEAFSHVTTLTGLKGRWQTLKQNPRVVCDTGHNLAGWEYLSQQLDNVKCHHLHIIFGMVDDKDVKAIMKLLPKRATYYFTKADNKRAIPEGTLLMLGNENGLLCNAFPSVSDAYEMVKNVAAHDDLIFVGGSTYVVSDFMRKCI